MAGTNRIGGLTRRAALGGGVLAAPSMAWATPETRAFAQPPWAGYHSSARRQAEAMQHLSTPDLTAPAADWRADLDLSTLAEHPSAIKLLDRTADDPARQFRLTTRTLAALFAANGLDPVEARERMDEQLILFALRGCTLVDPAMSGVPVKAVALAVQPVDHMTPRCTIGVWRRDTKRIAVFSGSTVPNRWAMAMQAAAFAQPGRTVWRMANVLATGRHDFIVGAHGGWQPSALISAGRDGRAIPQPAFRSKSGVLSKAEMVLDPVVVLDNIHPALTPSDPQGAAFSSEGCLTLAERTPPETWTRSPPDWTTFSELARLRRLPARERKLHGLVLLTGAEAWMAARGEAVERVRYGSRGPAAEAARRELGFRTGDLIDLAAYARLSAS